MHKDLKIGKNAEIGGQEVKKGGQRSNFEKQKKHTLVPFERYLVYEFERDISILSIVCTQNKIEGKFFACVPPP